MLCPIDLSFLLHLFIFRVVQFFLFASFRLFSSLLFYFFFYAVTDSTEIYIFIYIYIIIIIFFMNTLFGSFFKYITD